MWPWKRKKEPEEKHLYRFEVYMVNGVYFHGVKGQALLQAKGPGYADFLDKEIKGRFKPWFGKTEISRAIRQIYASEGARIEWHVAEHQAVRAFDSLVAALEIVDRPNLFIIDSP
jgi:filamentous hemagglutinin